MKGLVCITISGNVDLLDECKVLRATCDVGKEDSINFCNWGRAKPGESKAFVEVVWREKLS